jgi:hypothetical protein
MYKPGDVVLVDSFDFYSFFIKLGNWWSRLFDRNKSGIKINHEAIFVDNENIIEAVSKGTIIRKFPYKKGYFVYRKNNLTPQQESILVNEAINHKSEPYAWWLIVCLAVLKFFRIEWIMNGMGYKGEICSVLVAKCYAKIGYKFKDDEVVDLIDPGDMAYTIMSLDKNSWTLVESK